MIIKLELPDYTAEGGFHYNWAQGFSIKTGLNNNSIVISANKTGLISLANHLLNLAQDTIPDGFHLHLDEYNSLEEGSLELMLEKNNSL